MGAPEQAKILLVDDQPARLLTYEAILDDLGEDLVRATSGHEALAQLMRHEFAVVLLDVHMPDLDGFEVASLIFKHPRSEKTPVIFVTGVHLTDLDRLKGYEIGAVDYVSVPVVPQILRSKVAVFVELYRKRQAEKALSHRLAEAHAQLARDHGDLRNKSARELADLNLILQSANAELSEANERLKREVTERARAEQALLHADHNKDEFLGILAHELRNPLGAAQTALQAARALSMANPQLERLHAMLERQLAAVTNLAQDLLDIAAIGQGKITLVRQPVELAGIIESVLETLSPKIKERQHQLTVQLSAQHLRVNGDPMRLAQVLGNVLGNAAKYTEPGGQITLAVRTQGDEVAIHIRDSGLGIAPERLAGIFDLFVQAAPQDRSGRGGLGIGLTLARRLLQMHDGRISAHSEGLGHGSEFVIHLPLFIENAS